MISIKTLRKSGYKVRVLHFRNIFDNKSLEKGGKTVIQIRTPDGQEIEGQAVCSDKDNYNKRIGIQIALGRALSSIQKNNFSCRPEGWFINSGGPCGLIKNSNI